MSENRRDTMTMMEWYATEGGRKCPECGRYAKSSELGFTGGFMYDESGKRIGHIASYGHLPGFGCNKTKSSEETNGTGGLGKAG